MNKQTCPIPPELQSELEKMPPAAKLQTERIWKLIEINPEQIPGIPDTDSAWHDLERRIEAGITRDRKVRAVDRSPVQNRRRLRVGIPLSTALIVLLAAIWLWKQPVTVVAPDGSQEQVHLPDGSVVDLNSGTSIRYARGFNSLPFIASKQRTVELEGEAFFDVREGENPFVIRTFNAQIEVMGTKFNVRARRAAGAAETRVTLSSGTVGVSSLVLGGEKVVLNESGQVASVMDEVRLLSGPSQRGNRLDHVTAWRQKGFVAVDQPLASILEELERRYAIQIRTSVNVPLTDSLSVYYLNGARVEQILQDICLGIDCRFRKTSRGYYVYLEAGSQTHQSMN